MEYLAKIIEVERSKNKQFWRYAFLDLKTNQTDWFVNNYRINYVPNLAGKLELTWDKSKKYKIYQDFKQDIVNLTEEEEEILFHSQEDTEINTKRLAKDLVRKKKKELIVRQIDKLRKIGCSWDWIADFFEISKRDIRRKRKSTIKPLQKAGRKRIMDKKDIYFLLSYLSTNKATLKEMSKYLLEKRDKDFSQSTIFLALERIRYSYQVINYRSPKRKANLAEVIEFIERVNNLSSKQILSTDESGFPLNLSRKKAWGPKAEKVVGYKSPWGKNYTLILIIRNVKKGGIVHWDLIKDAVGTDVFHNFLSNVELLVDEKYYLLLDNIPFHKSKKIEELLKSKNIEPRYVVPSNPFLNPVELVFHVIKDYVEKHEPRTEEALRTVLTKIINILQEEDMTKYFRDCLNYDFILKTDNNFKKSSISFIENIKNKPGVYLEKRTEWEKALEAEEFTPSQPAEKTIPLTFRKFFYQTFPKNITDFALKSPEKLPDLITEIKNDIQKDFQNWLDFICDQQMTALICQTDNYSQKQKIYKKSNEFQNIPQVIQWIIDTNLKMCYESTDWNKEQTKIFSKEQGNLLIIDSSLFQKIEIVEERESRQDKEKREIPLPLHKVWNQFASTITLPLKNNFQFVIIDKKALIGWKDFQKLEIKYDEFTQTTYFCRKLEGGFKQLTNYNAVAFISQ